MKSALLLLALSQAPAEVSPAQRLIQETSAQELVVQRLEDGQHVRFGTQGLGPVHVYWPAQYRAESADVVVYLHGFFTEVDQAFVEHRLATQFRDSGRNALFIAPLTRSGAGDAIGFASLAALFAQVRSQVKVKWPARGVTLLGHSGAYKTVAAWVADASVRRVLLVDGLYGNDAELLAWLDGAPERRLVLVGFETQARAEGVLKRRDAARFDDVPYLFDALPARARSAKLVVFQSERFDHMALITQGRLLPWLLRAFPPG